MNVHLLYTWDKMTDTISPTTVDELTKTSPFAQMPHRVAKTTFRRAGREIFISTVFLTVNHNFSICETDATPILFETMVFGLPRSSAFSDLMVRYATSTEARKGHARVVKDVKRHTPGWRRQRYLLRLADAWRREPVLNYGRGLRILDKTWKRECVKAGPLPDYCSACDGSGQVKDVANTDAEWVDDPPRLIDRTPEMTCPACNGRGYVYPAD